MKIRFLKSQFPFQKKQGGSNKSQIVDTLIYLVYKCSEVDPNSWTNVSGNKLYSYQPTVISEEHYGSISHGGNIKNKYLDYEKHRSIEVLEHKDYYERRVK